MIIENNIDIDKSLELELKKLDKHDRISLISEVTFLLKKEMLKSKEELSQEDMKFFVDSYLDKILNKKLKKNGVENYIFAF